MNKMWEILVPTVRNDGRPISTKYHKVWDNMVSDLTNGLTILKPTIGHWVDPKDDTLYKERMIPVRIMCDNGTITKIMDMTAMYYEQKAILAYAVSTECILKDYDIDEENPSCPTHDYLQSVRGST